MARGSEAFGEDPRPGREKVAAEVRALMARHRVSQKQLGLATGISQSKLSRRLTCEQPFDSDEFYKIAQFFLVDVKQLFGDKGGSTSTCKSQDRYIQLPLLQLVRS